MDIQDEIVNAVMELLYNRKDFDDWWDGIDDDIQDEIKEELKNEIEKILESENK